MPHSGRRPDARVRRVVTALWLVGATFAVADVQAREIPIGLVAPLTGKLAAEGQLVHRAAADIVAAINESGGLGDSQITLHILDDHCDAAASRAGAEELIRRMRVVATVGHCRRVVDAVRNTYEEARTPLIVPNAGRADFDLRPSQFVFHLGVSPDRLAEAAFRLMREQGLGNRIGVVSDGDRFSEEVVRELSRYAQPVFVVGTSAGSTLTEQLIATRADVLFVASSSPDQLAPHLHRTEVPIVMTGLPTTPALSWKRFWDEMYNASWSVLSRVHVVSLGGVKPRTVWGSLVLNRWRNRYSSTPPDAYLTVVASFELLADILNDRPMSDGTAVAQALMAKPRPTILGELRAIELGEIPVSFALVPGHRLWTPLGELRLMPGGKRGRVGPVPTITPLPLPSPFKQVLLAAAPTPQDGPLLAYWNAWFERDRTIASRLELNKDYRFVLDLSRYERKSEASAAVSAEAGEILASARQSANFTVRVLFTGGVVRLNETESAAIAKPLPVTVPRLRRTDLNADELARWREGRLETSVYLSKASAAHIQFDVVTMNEGCGAVAVSVWDGPGLRPLDHVTYEYAVGDPTKCQHDRLVAGLGTVLSISTLLEEPSPSQADAALHIFELPSGARDHGSVVWFIDRAALEHSRKTGGRAGEYVWQTQSSLRQYVQTPTQLPALLQEARVNATAGAAWPYAKVADELRAKLFSVQNDAQFGEAARGAESALAKLVNQSKGPPVILARMAVSPDALDYLPLGLLAARGDKPLLQRPFITVQPLRRERFPHAQVCVDPWTLGIPTSLSELDETLQNELKQFSLDAPPWPHVWARDIATLKRSFRRDAAPGIARTEQGEGIVLLAHHSDGNLWFESVIDRLTQEHFERSFRRGSAAFLSACSIGGPGPLSYKLIEKLNALNVDTMIVSPFPVPADFGTRLALSFVRAVDDARRAKSTPTIAELYVSAWSQATQYFQRYGQNLQDMGLEFVILGDPAIRLCAN